MPHLERVAVAAIVATVALLLSLSLFWTGEVTRTALEPGAFVRADEAVALEVRAWDLSRPVAEPVPLAPGETAPATIIPISANAMAPPPEASGAPPDGAASVAREARSYEIREGDRLETIAARELGSRAAVAAILAANPELDPKRLRAGRKIQLPGAAPGAAPKSPATAMAPNGPAPEEARKRPAPAEPKRRAARAPSRVHAVKQGETLWTIATRTLGDGQRWREIAARNPAAFGAGGELRAGTVLDLP